VSAIAIEEDVAGGIASYLAASYDAVSEAVLKDLDGRAPQTLSAYEWVKAFLSVGWRPEAMAGTVRLSRAGRAR
jgi:hypothetical protein